MLVPDLTTLANKVSRNKETVPLGSGAMKLCQD